MRAKVHKISIPVILEVGADRMRNLGCYLRKAEISKIVVFFGANIRDLFGETVLDSIRSEEPGLQLLRDYDFDDNSIDKVIANAFTLPSGVEAVVGIGGGKVLDVAKYIAFLNSLPFVSVPTSTAHDGFASSGCSLIIQGRRTSVHARMPYGVVVDIGVVKRSPERFIFSGIGDIISKITAVYDWQYEESKGVGMVNDFSVMIAKKSVNSIARMPFTSIQDDFFIKELVDSLTMSGISMEMASSSAPASGGEHLISHALDKILEKPQLHGIQVGLATYIMSQVQSHRHDRVARFLTETGFFRHVETLGLKASDYEKAIDLAPSIKPNRHTFLHEKIYQERAKQFLYQDELLKSVFI